VGTIDVAAGTGFIKTSDSATGTTKSFDWDADTAIALTDNKINYVYMDYNGGAPVVGVTGTTLHILSFGIRLTELAYNEHERLISVRGFERASGGEISETGQRYLTSGAGVFYFGLNRITTSAQDTSGADRFTYWYRDGGGGWTKVTGQQQIDNTHYDDGSGALATLTANRYGVHWVYIHFDSDINVIYGQGNYKLAEAENAVLPDTVPELVSDFGVLAAKIVVQKSGANLLTVKSAYKELFPTTFPPKLSDLTDVNAETPNDNDVLSWDAGTSRWIAEAGGGGVSTFLGLTDTPANYTGQAGKYLKVNAGEDALEFTTPAGGASVFTDLTDTPANYTNKKGYIPAVVDDEDELKFINAKELPPKKTADDPPDDEFEADTLDGKWTLVDGASGTVDLIGNAGNIYDLSTRRSIILAVSPAVTCDADGGGVSNNEVMIKLSLNDDDSGHTAGNSCVISIDCQTNGMRVLYYDGSNYYGTGGTNDLVNFGQKFFLRILRDGTDYYGFYSLDCETWVSLYKLSYGSALNNVWIAVDSGATVGTPVPIQAFDWIRLGDDKVCPW